MKFSYNWLKDLARFKESPARLAELLTLRSFEVESVVRAKNDWTLDVKITANRTSDAAHHIGLAREIAVAHGYAPKLPMIQTKGFTKGTFPRVRVSIAGGDLTPRYIAVPIRISKVGTSPRWMQERLIASGFRPLNAVVDVTNYVMCEMGIPLHAFDFGKIQGHEMRIREAHDGEELETLDGVKRSLPKGAIIIEDAKRIIDLAGIMGGENSAVSKETKELFLQAAVFDSVRIYRTTRALGFSSAASKMYAAGVSPSRTEDALWRSIGLLKECGVFVSHGNFIDQYPKKEMPKKIRFRPEYADQLIGEHLHPDFYRKIFTLLGFRISRRLKGWDVEVSPVRRDIVAEEDLIEEAMRFYGYEKIKPRMPAGALASGKENDEVMTEFRIREYLSGKGFSESLLRQFASPKELELFSIDPRRAIALENPLNPETTHLTPRVLIQYIESAAANMRNFNSVRIFGIGKSFRKRESGKGLEGIDEHKDLILAVAEKGSGGDNEFFELKGTIDSMLEAFGIHEHWYDDALRVPERKTSFALFHPYRSAEIRANSEKIGVIGEIHPAILEELKSHGRIVAAEIDFSALLRHIRTEQEFRSIPKFPAITRDISLIVPSDVNIEDVSTVIEAAGGSNLLDTDLFDYFEDEEMKRAGRKSIAFHLIFQAEDRTLTDEEADQSVLSIIQALEEMRWEVRR